MSKRIIVLSVATIGFLSFLAFRAVTPRVTAGQKSSPRTWVGETIRYDVYFGRLRLGEASFRHEAVTKLQNRDVHLMTVTTKLSHFFDEEKIYADSLTWLPIRIERTVNIWFSKEKIVEEYDPDVYSVLITKYKGSKQEQTRIVKDGAIQNSVLLPYALRRTPELKEGWSFTANLPTRRLVISLTGVEDITVPAGTFKAYHFTSDPRQCEIWISADEKRVPLKITGTGAFGYSLVLTEYVSAPQ